jgi:quinol-cytochrome oxidoreductase complex cytochrome b subunit
VIAASVGYNITLFLHLVAVVAAFGPLLLMGRLHQSDPVGAARVYLRTCLPALVLVWVFGMGVVGSSGDGADKIALSDTWIVLSLLVWVVMVAIAAAVIMPAVKVAGDASRSRLMAGLGASHLLMVIAVALMVFKPGA